MKRAGIFLVLAIVLSFLFPIITEARFEGDVQFVFVDEVIWSTNTATSSVFLLDRGEYYGVWYKATSDVGAPDIKIECQMSYNTTAGNFVEPDGMADIVTNLTSETAHVERLSCPPMKYMRFYVTGNAANSTDTVVNMYFFKQNME